jgi:uncharacterized protein YqfA (UPF0365 family)
MMMMMTTLIIIIVIIIIIITIYFRYLCVHLSGDPDEYSASVEGMMDTRCCLRIK